MGDEVNEALDEKTTNRLRKVVKKTCRGHCLWSTETRRSSCWFSTNAASTYGCQDLVGPILFLPRYDYGSILPWGREYDPANYGAEFMA